MENIGIQPIYLIAQIVNFAIIIFLLNKFLYKPILKMLDARKQKIEEQMTLASKMKEEFEKDEKKRQQMLSVAKEEAKKIVEVAKKTGKTKEAEIIEIAKKEAYAIAQKAKDEIASEKEAMKKALEKETIDLAAQIAEKIIADALEEKDQEHIIQRKVRDISKLIAQKL